MLHRCECGGYGSHMEISPLADRIIAAFDEMSAQLQTAARYVLERPRDVALLSMRQQARRAGIQPATMTRFAKRLGLTGYDAVRKIHADAVRSEGLGFAGKAGTQVANQKLRGDRALSAEMVETLGAQIRRLAAAESLAELTGAAKFLATARRIFCLGLRSSYPIAWHFHYVLSLLGERSLLLDAPAGTGIDRIRSATPKDALFVASVQPYTRETIDAARYAAARKVPIVAVTDSAVSPLAQIARHRILVATQSPSFFHTMTPGFVVAEILAALVAGRGGVGSLSALQRTERQLSSFDVHWVPRSARTGS